MINRERRSAKRISYLCEVEWEGNGMSRVNTLVNDLSTTGAFIDSMTCFGAGTVLKLKFRVRDVVIETAAEVRYSLPHVGMGVHFLDLTAHQIAALESLIEGKPMMPVEEVPESVLSGNFAVVSLFDVIQMVENSRLTGTLFLEVPRESGEVNFNDGLIASAQSGTETDQDALHKFVGVRVGTFEFRKTDKPFAQTIHAATNAGLLLDLTRVKEEELTLSRR